MPLASANVCVSPSTSSRATDLAAERYVGFAFAAADLLIETDLDGEILFAAGAFHTRLGEDAASFLGRPLASLFSPLSHTALDVAMALIGHIGRISPMQLILADASPPHIPDEARSWLGIQLISAGRHSTDAKVRRCHGGWCPCL